MHDTARRGTAIWLVVLALAQTAALIAVWRIALHTELGQWLDTVALTGNRIGQDRIDGPVNYILNVMSVAALLAATTVIGFIALIRGHVAFAVTATLLIVGANLTTQALKYSLARPDFGIDPQRVFAGNSLPSGHATVAASFAVALVFVLPPRVRLLGALLGTGYAAAVGVATLSAGWHRPSDAIAAYLVVGVWAALGGLALLFMQRERAGAVPGDAHRLAAGLLGTAGLLAVVAGGLALAWLADGPRIAPDELGRRPLFAGYAGGAAGIAGTMGIVMALVLVSAHRLIPGHRPIPARRPIPRNGG